MSQKAVPRVYGIVPAAGQSRRMGAPKPLLPLWGAPLLMAALEPLKRRLDGVAAVTRTPIAEALRARAPEVSWLINDDPDAGMIDSVRIGLAHWRERGAGPGDGALICPGDAPGLAEATVRACAAAFQGAPDRIHIASHGGRRGHPIVFAFAHAEFILSPACDAGLRALARCFPEQVSPVERDDPAILRNVNTPQDYGGLPHGQ